MSVVVTYHSQCHRVLMRKCAFGAPARELLATVRSELRPSCKTWPDTHSPNNDPLIRLRRVF